MLSSKLSRRSQSHSRARSQVHSQLHSMAHSQPVRLYGPKYALKTLSITLPSTLSSTLPIALDDTLPACLTIRSQVSSQNTPKNNSEYAPKYTSLSLTSTLSRGKTHPISLDYMLPFTLLHAQSSDLLSCRSQAPEGVMQVVYGAQCLAGGMWHVMCGRLWAAYSGRNHDVGRYHSLNLIFSAPTKTKSHDAS